MTSSVFQLTSPDISEGHFMAKIFEFNGFGCDGPNLSPALNWQNAPAGTQSFAITVFDPDAPTGSGFWHWLVLDIPATVTSLAQGAGNGQLPKGSRSFNNDYGIKEFGGACPPEGHGMHRYQFTVWALPETTLAVPDGASAAVVGFMLNATAIGKATLTATYAR
ncbi:MAG: YbhB/YbcL family Raf kinase inhibitor-like protein [Gammaproteobacteria bacterium]|nr:YbhB/YbcL family Raf kinase inhibitor-like protein [Gammaproteobacteria bacterium]MBU2057630.1 YbhB/YbcL family Raf kinase inhibitor-like protein [Gammaproteobacteria bacterium]MBU2175610.1 YbhB/YbcL family Raf kinase inhibitor-like protein [Gammaproteobacteria bacterium]MBU2246014.1 YbhB/YbcL family Raf kinase inhibitor-like protein [Gammaproteobacteria bacterium]MBU2343267.1 YbhB/YbcL family Raf kinase inhibitor-like protein [Gammaproteobacteria bacterium]